MEAPNAPRIENEGKGHEAAAASEQHGGAMTAIAIVTASPVTGILSGAGIIGVMATGKKMADAEIVIGKGRGTEAETTMNGRQATATATVTVTEVRESRPGGVQGRVLVERLSLAVCTRPPWPWVTWRRMWRTCLTVYLPHWRLPLG